MPQLDQLALVYLSQWFWLLLVLGTIFFFVGRGIVPKVEATVDERDAKVAADLAEAARLQNEAEASEEAWRSQMNVAHGEVQALTAEAKAQATRDLEKRVAEADAVVAQNAAVAEAALEKARVSALAELETVAAEAAQDIVAKLSGKQVDDEAARKAVAGVLNHA